MNFHFMFAKDHRVFGIMSDANTVYLDGRGPVCYTKGNDQGQTYQQKPVLWENASSSSLSEGELMKFEPCSALHIRK